MIGFELIYAAFVWGWVDNRDVYMSYMYIGYSISIMEEADKNWSEESSQIRTQNQISLMVSFV